MISKITLVSVILLSWGTSQLAAKPYIEVFPGEPLRRPQPLSCDGKAKQTLRVDEAKRIILWDWRNKSNASCQWHFDGLPIINLEAIKDDFSLEVVLSGTFDENAPPQVKFLDAAGSATGLVNLDTYIDKDGITEKKFLIPLTEFSLVNLRNPKKVTKLQFDAHWNSEHGDIAIRSIRLVKKRTSK